VLGAVTVGAGLVPARIVTVGAGLVPARIVTVGAGLVPAQAPSPSGRGVWPPAE
jgi:hypothetical protein